MSNLILRSALISALALCVAALPAPNAHAPTRAPQRLSEFGFFQGKIADLKPAPRVWPYEVNAPLFSDYAEKARFVYLPEGTAMQYRPDHAFELPTGAALIKNFYYPHEATAPEKSRRILETRILLKEPDGWRSLEYIWSDDQSDAMLDVVGATIPVSWRDAADKLRRLDYATPNLNQCKGCHAYRNEIVPLGFTARQLHRPLPQGGEQLARWIAYGALSLPQGLSLAEIPRLADYRLDDAALLALHPHADPRSLPELRARAYLDGNCGHCHNPHGAANTSGMFLDIHTDDPARWGVNKPPVAAGRGAGKRRFGIAPGKPRESILLFRMESNDPGIRMPELGRAVAHQEGIEIIREWIKSLR